MTQYIYNAAIEERMKKYADNDIVTAGQKNLFKGMTGPVDGKEYPDVMPPMGQNDDEYIAAVLTEIGDRNAEIRPVQVEQIRKETEERKDTGP